MLVSLVFMVGCKGEETGAKCGAGTRLENGICVAAAPTGSATGEVKQTESSDATSASPQVSDAAVTDAPTLDDAAVGDAAVSKVTPKKRARRCIANNRPCLSERVTDSSDSMSCAHCCSGRYAYAQPGELPEPQNLGESELDALCRCATRECHANGECCNGKCVPPEDNYTSGGVGHCYGSLPNSFPSER